MAMNVLAHPDPVSAASVPDLLRDVLIERKSIRDVFVSKGFDPITEQLHIGPKMRTETAEDVLRKDYSKY
jgi:hypothetical protein